MNSSHGTSGLVGVNTAMIVGAHTIVYSSDVDATRAWFRDVLGFPYVDAHDGWLIFSLPPAEIGIHPGEESRHELYLMCDDIEKTVEDLLNKGVQFASEITEQSWGRLISIKVPGGGELGLYEPRHPLAPH